MPRGKTKIKLIFGEHILCYSCKGKGTKKGESCRACKGLGFVSTRDDETHQ